MQRDTGLFIQHDKIVITGLYLRVDNEKVMLIIFSQENSNMSRDMTKPTKRVCAQRRLKSAWVSAQSDQSLCCPHEESLGP